MPTRAQSITDNTKLTMAPASSDASVVIMSSLLAEIDTSKDRQAPISLNSNNSNSKDASLRLTRSGVSRSANMSFLVEPATKGRPRSKSEGNQKTTKKGYESNDELTPPQTPILHSTSVSPSLQALSLPEPNIKPLPRTPPNNPYPAIIQKLDANTLRQLNIKSSTQ